VNGMAEVIQTEKAKKITSNARSKTIEYSCGCSYLFDHYIILKRIYPEHETHLITYHG
jgi:hypothetical protein